MSNRFAKGAQKAAERADERTAGAQARLAPPTWDAIREMLPEPADQEELDRLMEIVRAESSHNEKVASLVNNIGDVAGVVVKALGNFR